MIVTFDKEYLRELYITGKCSDKKHRFQPDVIKRYKRCVDTLVASHNVESLYKHNSLNYEVLSGDKKGLSSVRVTSKYRIEFTVKVVADTETIVSVCNIIELSNHYK
ncbi:type II toxin-antitoxin system RelE/ParE family toxin [Bacteroides sp. UBA939]|uniref:type II toxin-antitoxin system RelE/ParE family toxin n=1 Tax=Bacteroides sp. UBA939 TaxID=1946092 RepID=UPI0025C1A0BB|nr:type II toxin-antitoxin system RelE/ParE family toxin [Bacteroides sp. UBA939]